MVISNCLLYSLQVPLPVVVSVRLTSPFVLSFGPGIYLANSVFLLGLNEPSPVVVQVPPEAVVIIPLIFTSFSLLQIVRLSFTTTVGISLKVITMSSETKLHEPFPSEVSLKVTLPVNVSLLDG